MWKSEYHMEVGASMASVLSLSTQISLFTAWQLGQLRLRQELLWTSVWLQSGQMLTLQPNVLVLHRRMDMAAFFWMWDGG